MLFFVSNEIYTSFVSSIVSLNKFAHFFTSSITSRYSISHMRHSITTVSRIYQKYLLFSALQSALPSSVTSATCRGIGAGVIHMLCQWVILGCTRRILMLLLS